MYLTKLVSSGIVRNNARPQSRVSVSIVSMDTISLVYVLLPSQENIGCEEGEGIGRMGHLVGSDS